MAKKMEIAETINRTMDFLRRNRSKTSLLITLLIIAIAIIIILYRKWRGDK